MTKTGTPFQRMVKTLRLKEHRAFAKYKGPFLTQSTEPEVEFPETLLDNFMKTRLDMLHERNQTEGCGSDQPGKQEETENRGGESGSDDPDDG